MFFIRCCLQETSLKHWHRKDKSKIEKKVCKYWFPPKTTLALIGVNASKNIVSKYVNQK